MERSRAPSHDDGPSDGSVSRRDQPRLVADLELPTAPDPTQFLSDATASANQLFAFDFDGTLIETAPHPDAVAIPPDFLATLEQASKRHRLLLCTGRALRDLDRFVPPHLIIDRICNHGLEWRTRDGTVRNYLLPDWENWRMEFLVKLGPIIDAQGGVLEDKEFSLTLHFRSSGMAWWGGILGRVWLESQVEDAPVQLLPGKMTWNLIPQGFSKGRSLARYAQENGIARVVYFGDEATDESVFRQGVPQFGSSEVDWVGVKVGEGPTSASFRVAEPRDVRDWLGQLSMLDSGLT